MGAIMAVGIVHKNGILMLDAEQYFSGRGIPLRQAVFEAGLAVVSSRSRPALPPGQRCATRRPRFPRASDLGGYR